MEPKSKTSADLFWRIWDTRSLARHNPVKPVQAVPARLIQDSPCSGFVLGSIRYNLYRLVPWEGQQLVIYQTGKGDRGGSSIRFCLYVSFEM